jgi:hypothetical protein
MATISDYSLNKTYLTFIFQIIQIVRFTNRLKTNRGKIFKLLELHKDNFLNYSWSNYISYVDIALINCEDEFALTASIHRPYTVEYQIFYKRNSKIEYIRFNDFNKAKNYKPFYYTYFINHVIFLNSKIKKKMAKSNILPFVEELGGGCYEGEHINHIHVYNLCHIHHNIICIKAFINGDFKVDPIYKKIREKFLESKECKEFKELFMCNENS